MYISPIALYSIGANNLKTKPSAIGFLGNYPNDDNKNTKEALNTADKLLKLKAKDISIDKIRRIFSDVKLIPAQKADIDAIAAISYPIIQGKINRANTSIIIPEIFCKNKLAKTIFIMNLAHEYTHVCQIKNNENIDETLYKDVISAGFSPETYHPIYAIAHSCNEIIEKDLMRISVGEITGQEGQESFKTTGGLILINRKIDEDIIAQSLGFKNAKAAKENFKTIFSGFEGAAQTLCERVPELKEKCKINNTETYEKIKKIIIDFCKNSSNAEYEANLTEYLIAKKQNYDDKSSEIVYKFHKLITQALS